MKSKIIKSRLTFSCYHLINIKKPPYPQYTKYLNHLLNHTHQKYNLMKTSSSKQRIYCYFRMNLTNKQIMDYLDPQRQLYNNINIRCIYDNLIKVELIANSLLSYNITVNNYYKLSSNGSCRPFIFQIQNQENKNNFFIYKSSIVAIKNLNANVVQQQLNMILSPFGKFQILFFPLQKSSPKRIRNLRFAFIKFQNHYNAWACAIVLSNAVLHNSVFKVHVSPVMEILQQTQQQYIKKLIQDGNMNNQYVNNFQK